MKDIVRNLAIAHAKYRKFGANRIHSLCEHYIRAYYNSDNDPYNNGEYEVLRKISAMPVKCILDVGANEGEWASKATQYAPKATVHCFDIVDTVAERLESRFRSNPLVKVHKVGLSIGDGLVEVRYDPERADVSTVYVKSSFWRGNAGVIKCRTTRGDLLCRREGIDEIDILKVDTEGHDLEVIRGFGEFIPAHVKVIQFEYNEFAIDARVYLRDYFDWLASYEIGRILLGGVEFKEYSVKMENFRYANFIAVRKDLRGLVDMLKVAGGRF